MNDMTNSNLDSRESKVLDFINAKNKEASLISQQQSLEMSPELQRRKLNSESQKAVSICLDTLLGRLYKDALPFDDPKKNYSDDTMADEIRDYISKRTDGRNSEYYIREAIKRTNSQTLKNMLSEATSISKKFLMEKGKAVGTINIKDLNFKMNLDQDELSNITKKLEFDEIADIIKNNVQQTIQDESDKAKREEEYNSSIEDSLADDVNVQDDTSMESAIEKMVIIKQPTVYQPSLFEAIMLGHARYMKESTGEDAFHEAVHEYTKLSISKALKLEKFDLTSVKKLANSYLG